MSNIIVSIHQPSYFPWLGLLDKINNSDIFISMDDVQLADRAYQHRNIFFGNGGKEHMLTIPINKKNYRGKAIREITISDNGWQKKHARYLVDIYKKYPYFDDIYPNIDFIFQKDYKYLIDILHDTMQVTINLLDIDVDFRLQSDLEYNKNSKKSDLILELLSTIDKNSITYLSGAGAKDYQDNKDFEERNIELAYQNFKHPTYSQFRNKQEFISGLSSVDMMFNIGKEKSIILLNEKR